MTTGLQFTALVRTLEIAVFVLPLLSSDRDYGVGDSDYDGDGDECRDKL